MSVSKLRPYIAGSLVKVDTVVAMKYLVNPDRYKNLSQEIISLIRNHNDDLTRVWRELDNNPLKYKHLIGFPEKFIKKGIVELYSDILRFQFGRFPSIRFRCKKGDFNYEFVLCISHRIYIMVSQSLHNYSTSSYFKFTAKKDYSNEMYKLLEHVDVCLKTFFEYYKVVTDPQWYEKNGWFLKRIDLAKDVYVGEENYIGYFEVARRLKIPGYEKRMTKEDYKVDFQPVYKGGYQEFGSNRRYDLPTINFYNKSEELRTLLPEHLQSEIPLGWLRLELQFYQGKRRKSMQNNSFEVIRRNIRLGKPFTNEELEKCYKEFDLFSSNLAIVENEQKVYTHTLKEKIRRAIYDLSGMVRKKDIANRLGLFGAAKKSLDIVIRDMVLGGELKRKGHTYSFTVERINELDQRYREVKHHGAKNQAT